LLLSPGREADAPKQPAHGEIPEISPRPAAADRQHGDVDAVVRSAPHSIQSVQQDGERYGASFNGVTGSWSYASPITRRWCIPTVPRHRETYHVQVFARKRFGGRYPKRKRERSLAFSASTSAIAGRRLRLQRGQEAARGVETSVTARSNAACWPAMAC